MCATVIAPKPLPEGVMQWTHVRLANGREYELRGVTYSHVSYLRGRELASSVIGDSPLVLFNAQGEELVLAGALERAA